MELLSEWVATPLKRYSQTSFKLAARPLSFAEAIGAGRFKVQEAVRYYLISWAVATFIRMLLDVHVPNPDFGLINDDLFILFFISSSSLILATFAYLPLIWSGSKGRYIHTCIAVLFVSAFFYPVVILLEGVGKQAGLPQGLLGSLGLLAIPVYWVLLLGTLHRIARGRVSIVVLLAFLTLALGLSVAWITGATLDRVSDDFVARARYDRDYDRLNNLLYQDIRSSCSEDRQPRFSDSYYLRGTLFLDQGKLEQANADFSQAIDREPADPYYLNSRGTALFEMGDYANSIQDFERVTGIEPTKAKAHYNRGLAYYQLGLYRVAGESFASALALNSDDNQSKMLLGQALSLSNATPGTLQPLEVPPDSRMDERPVGPMDQLMVQELMAIC
ncbi:MAG: tetratricopeptide repeat protein [Chloroflexi bacterium]|nr:tetratricopeptide repeat protein [Chloroflexota bacterium]